MVQPIVLDVLLLLIMLFLIPLGFYRGGLREVCSAAGLLLGLLVANEWAARWGTWIASRIGAREDVSRFVVAVAVLTFVTIIVGYGAGAAFSYRPGPGGRMYGGLISLLIGAVFLGSVMNFVSRFLSDGDYPAVIEDGYLTRALSIGLDWVLLLVGLAVVLATLFGMIVRERDTGDHGVPTVYQVPPDVVASAPPWHAAPPDKLEPPVPAQEGLATQPTSAVTIKEVRHWEDTGPPPGRDRNGEWHRTWPGRVKGNSIRSRSDRLPSRRSTPILPPEDQQTTGSQDARVIQDWLSEDRDDAPANGTVRPANADE